MPSETNQPRVLVEREGKTVVLTLNRPDRYNALNHELRAALLIALRDVADDAAVRAVVLTGAGRGFCVGQDLDEHAATLHTDPSSALRAVTEHYNPITRTLTGMPKPVIAAINGSCAGAGLGFAMSCDLRIAAEGTKFSTAFTGIGLTADSGLSASLTRALGASRAGELLLLSEPFTAEQAAEWGLVRSVVAAEAVREAALALAGRLAEGPTLAYAEVKQALRLGATAALDEILDHEAAAQTRLGVTRDHAAAVTAFLAKQRPTFEGR
ncbi:MAG: enoyl-CoA hydratase/isomerase family protein [Pseudonocardiaceae bacterium]